MKSIMFIFVSIVFLSGCEYPTDPDKDIDIDIHKKVYWFFANVKVETKSGIPCPDATLKYIYFSDYSLPYTAIREADSLGIIRARYHANTNYHYISFESIIYKYGDISDDSPRWNGYITFYKSEEEGKDLDPFIVVFPDDP